MSQPIIQLDIETARQTVGTLHQAHDELVADIGALVSTVDALLPTWDGDGKNQFSAAWNDWLRGMGQVLAAAPALASGIQREADEIEAADASSGYRAS